MEELSSLLESRDVVGNAVEEKATDKGCHNSHDIVESHEKWIPT